MAQDLTGKTQTVDILSNSLGYVYPARIQGDTQRLFHTHHFLKPTNEVFYTTSHHGSGQNHIKLYGTVAVVINRQNYYIPVDIWIPKRYPEVPPVVFVVPSQGMVLSRQHPRLGTNGECTLRSNWNKAYTMLDCINDLRDAFQRQSPVHAAPAGGVAHQPQHQPQPQQHQPHGGGYSHYDHQPPKPLAYNPNYSPASSTVPVSNPYASATAPSCPSPIVPPVKPAAQPDDSITQLSNALQAEITTSLTKLCVEMKANTEANLKSEVERQKTQQADLVKAQDALKASNEEEAKLLEEISKMVVELETTKTWLGQMEGKAVTSVEDIKPADELSQQILELTADVNAYDDMLRMADHVARSNPEQYVEYVTATARKKFLATSFLNKASAAAAKTA
eukprot:TRINITY_DN7573_c0_g1_i1.p1 TRINITY_DN7573_c0_g1~~TRINITY_DN7573_c0_g1_i1.p1  ORF type:complete len:392 (+),score=82.24 TRINITY_DN7573_c0_g1_i1:66-1241(+)